MDRRYLIKHVIILVLIGFVRCADKSNDKTDDNGYGAEDSSKELRLVPYSDSEGEDDNSEETQTSEQAKSSTGVREAETQTDQDTPQDSTQFTQPQQYYDPTPQPGPVLYYVTLNQPIPLQPITEQPQILQHYGPQPIVEPINYGPQPISQPNDYGPQPIDYGPNQPIYYESPQPQTTQEQPIQYYDQPGMVQQTNYVPPPQDISMPGSYQQVYYGQQPAEPQQPIQPQYYQPPQPQQQIQPQYYQPTQPQYYQPPQSQQQIQPQTYQPPYDTVPIQPPQQMQPQYFQPPYETWPIQQPPQPLPTAGPQQPIQYYVPQQAPELLQPQVPPQQPMPTYQTPPLIPEQQFTQSGYPGPQQPPYPRHPLPIEQAQPIQPGSQQPPFPRHGIPIEQAQPIQPGSQQPTFPRHGLPLGQPIPRNLRPQFGLRGPQQRPGYPGPKFPPYPRPRLPVRQRMPPYARPRLPVQRHVPPLPRPRLPVRQPMPPFPRPQFGLRGPPPQPQPQPQPQPSHHFPGPMVTPRAPIQILTRPSNEKTESSDKPPKTTEKAVDETPTQPTQDHQPQSDTSEPAEPKVTEELEPETIPVQLDSDGDDGLTDQLSGLQLAGDKPTQPSQDKGPSKTPDQPQDQPTGDAAGSGDGQPPSDQPEQPSESGGAEGGDEPDQPKPEEVEGKGKRKICKEIKFYKKDEKGNTVPMTEDEYKIVKDNDQRTVYELTKNIAELHCDGEKVYIHRSTNYSCKSVNFFKNRCNFFFETSDGFYISNHTKAGWKVFPHNYRSMVKLYTRDGDGNYVLLKRDDYTTTITDRGCYKFMLAQGVKCYRIMMKNSVVWEGTDGEETPEVFYVTVKNEVVLLLGGKFHVYGKRADKYLYVKTYSTF
ncbi:SVSP family protein [Theileria parva strain Muguga]|uniref:SVSP family protein n=1 Tax=Theileria parva strain Muguga TaxID=333668 RepID=UPI001C61C065|nr:SVSP family protein [Theileria parva strain Muguga]EAN34465.2 SVSP family protein [Theileria parva strain Muguga]